MIQTDIINIYVKGRENDLINRYIEDGPEDLKQFLEVSDDQWNIIFDYLVFEQNLLYKCVTSNCDFFVNVYVKSGMAKIREMLNIEDDKYNCFIDQIFEYIAIVNDGLKKHVLEHMDRYSQAIQKRGRSFLRKVMYLNKSKYDQHWKMVLDLMLHSFTSDVAAYQGYEKCMRVFNQLVNGSREQRMPFKSGIFIE